MDGASLYFWIMSSVSGRRSDVGCPAAAVTFLLILVVSVKTGSGRPGVPTKPAALTSPRRASGKKDIVCVCVCVCVFHDVA